MLHPQTNSCFDGDRFALRGIKIGAIIDSRNRSDIMTATIDLPPSFLIGAATAAHQVEGGNVHNDWWQFEEDGRLPVRSGMACDHWHRYEADFDMAASQSHNAHRFSIEWSRIEPEQGKVSKEAIDHYRKVIQALRTRSIEPVVTLHHFTNPAWFAAKGGWINRDVVSDFRNYCEIIADALGDNVTYWITINEPTVYVKNAFVAGHWPPMKRGRWDIAFRIVRNMMAAHRAAYEVLHTRRSDCLVSFAHSAPYVEASRSHHLLDRTCAKVRDAILNDATFRMLGSKPTRYLDYIAVNYYTRTVVRWHPKGTAFLFGTDCLDDRDGVQPRQYSDLGWEVFPEGLGHIIRRLARMGLPIMITENGMATTNEGARIAYLRSHLSEIARAIANDGEAIGYMLWSLMDYFEWSACWEPKFGLAETDPISLERRPREAAAVLAEVARSRRLTLPRPNNVTT